MDTSEDIPRSSLSEQITRDYKIVRLLGKGGMGDVYLAEQLRVGHRPVALKVLNRSCAEDPDLKRRFENEAASAGRINHRNVVTVYESRVTDDGQLYVAMEYIEGSDLGHVIEQRGTLPLEEVVQITKQVAAGLAAAHKIGIVHRDVKPANIMLVKDEDGSLLVKVLDFGIARLSETDSSGAQTKTGVVMGTPHYMSPEQTLGQTGGKIDHRSDIYSLAMVVYQMLTGKLAFESDSWVQVMLKHVHEAPLLPSQVRPDLPHLGAIDEVIARGLEKDREKRQQSATEFANELEAAFLLLKSGGTQRDDTLRYPGSGSGAKLPFVQVAPTTPVAPASAESASDTQYTPTVLTNPQHGSSGGSAEANPEAFATMPMAPGRPTSASQEPVYSGAAGVSSPASITQTGKSPAGKRAAAAASAVILVGLVATAYFVLRGRGRPGEQLASTSSAAVGVAPSASPAGETAQIAATPSPIPSESRTEQASAESKPGNDNPKKTELSSTTPKHSADQTPSPVEPKRPAAIPTPLAAPATSAATPTPPPPATSAAVPPEESGEQKENCIGVLVLGTKGNPVPGASVTIVDQTSGMRINRFAGKKGRQRFCDLTPGHRYTVTALGPRGMMSGTVMHVLGPGRNVVTIQLQ